MYIMTSATPMAAAGSAHQNCVPPNRTSSKPMSTMIEEANSVVKCSASASCSDATHIFWLARKSRHRAGYIHRQ